MTFAKKMPSGSIMIDTPDGMDFFKVAQCKYALDIQVHTGLKYSRGSVWNYSKKRWGLTGNLKTVRDKLAIMVEMMQQEKERGTPVTSAKAAAFIEEHWDELKVYVPMVVKD